MATSSASASIQVENGKCMRCGARVRDLHTQNVCNTILRNMHDVKENKSHPKRGNDLLLTRPTSTTANSTNPPKEVQRFRVEGHIDKEAIKQRVETQGWKELRSRRLERGWSIQKAADKCGVSQELIRRLEMGLSTSTGTESDSPFLSNTVYNEIVEIFGPITPPAHYRREHKNSERAGF